MVYQVQDQVFPSKTRLGFLQIVMWFITFGRFTLHKKRSHKFLGTLHLNVWGSSRWESEVAWTGKFGGQNTKNIIEIQFIVQCWCLLRILEKGSFWKKMINLIVIFIIKWSIKHWGYIEASIQNVKVSWICYMMLLHKFVANSW